MAEQILTLAQMKQSIESVKADLTKLRGINSTLAGKLASLDNRQFQASYIAEQSAKLKNEAKQQAYQILSERGSLERLKAVRAQQSNWTTEAFLSRAPATEKPKLKEYDDAGNTVALLSALLEATRLNNTLLSVSQMNNDALGEAADRAARAGDWSSLGVIMNTLNYRASGDDDNARRARNRLSEIKIPDVQAANELVGEAGRLDEFLGYTLQGITAGDGSDLGQRMEGYAQQRTSKEEARNQAVVDQQAAREAYEIRNRMSQ